jgi:hypothetical protein
MEINAVFPRLVSHYADVELRNAVMRHWIILVGRVKTSLGGTDQRAQRRSYFIESLVVLALCLEMLSYAWLR